MGIPVGAHNIIAGELAAASPVWKSHAATAATVATLAMQLWMKPTVPELGFHSESRGETTLTSFRDPFNTWADMTHILESETWSPDRPGSVAYFCGPLETDEQLPDLSDHAYPKRSEE